MKTRAIEAAPGRPMAYAQRGLILLHTEKEAAERDFRNALRLDPGLRHFIESRIEEQSSQPEP